MGIPAYFSHIIKEHRDVLKHISSKQFGRCTHLFLDSNSIIYDVMRNQCYEPPTLKSERKQYDSDFEKHTIQELFYKNYVKKIHSEPIWNRRFWPLPSCGGWYAPY